MNICSCAEVKSSKNIIAMAQVSSLQEEDSSENDLVQKARDYLSTQADNLGSMKSEIEEEESDLENYPSLECDESLESLEEKYASSLANVQGELQSSLENSLE